MSTSLWRNRDFNLLWGGQVLSAFGSAVSALAFPLLVLALTGSPLQAGAVGTIAAVTALLCRLPVGLLVDRVNRRRAMLLVDLTRLLAFAALGLAVLTGSAGLPAIILVAVLDAAGSTLFSTAEHAALRSIVPAAQLPDAVARNEARGFAVGLVGPSAGGLLFGLGHAVPFLGNALTYLGSLISVALIRRPLQEERSQTPGGLTTGLRFVFGDPFLRAVLVIAAPLNFAITGILFTIVIALQQRGVAPAVIGLTETMIGVGGLIGAIAAPTLQRRLGLGPLVRTICWAAAGLFLLSALLTGSIAAAVPVAVMMVLAPACNAALFGYQAAITPDHLQGRVISVIFLFATSAAAVAPLLAGVLTSTWNATAATVLFAVAVMVSAVAATVSRGIRTLTPAPALT
ncbi:MFS transporter [Actinoplanes rectilineatus]|uniref:MFS transporter n=1 Tax=Actinoplanes rectilineatus TaxID=113571 RepID=UPI0005F28935|nr:MFS transporter [Actinoplanes rectilineatus]